MRKWLGDGKLIAAAVLAAGVAMIAVPAFGDSGSGTSRARIAAPRGGQLPPMPPAPALSGATRKKVQKTAECMKSRGVAGPGTVHRTAHGVFVGPDVSRKALAQAAKACGAPPPPPRGALLPSPMGAPGDRAKLNSAVTRCLHSHSQKRQR